jgi:hypothetical protein
MGSIGRGIASASPAHGSVCVETGIRDETGTVESLSTNELRALGPLIARSLGHERKT